MSEVKSTAVYACYKCQAEMTNEDLDAQRRIKSLEKEITHLRAAIEEFGCLGCTMHPCPPDCWVKVALRET